MRERLCAGWTRRGVWPIKPELVIEELGKYCMDDGLELQFFDEPP